MEDAFKKPAENLLMKIENGNIKIDKSTLGIKASVNSETISLVSLLPLISVQPDDKKKRTCC